MLLSAPTKILVVDDEPDVLHTLAAVLAAEGYAVTMEGSADAALARTRGEHFDVVLTDLMLSGLESGLEIVPAVRGHSPGTEVIVLTGFASDSSAVQALRDGAFQYLTKPCNLDELKMTVQRALQKQHLEQVARKAAHVETARAEAVRARNRLSVLFEQAPALIALCRGPRHRLEFANPAFLDVLGGDEERHLRSVLTSVGGRQVLELLDEVRAAGEPLLGHEIAFEVPKNGGQIEMLYFNFALQPTTDEQGHRDGIFVHAVDVTEQVRGRQRISQLADVLADQALHDSLTGLPNRRLLFDRLGQAIRAADRNHHRLGLLFLDLDGFKNVNDSLGHAAGDVVLREVGVAIQSCLRASDTVGRLGGDEFAVLLPGLDAPTSAAEVARKLRTRGRRPLAIDAHRLRIRASIGVAVFPEDGRDVASLMRTADAAMYADKRVDKRPARSSRRSA
ncbi:MAG: diguanylate cyclase domain-containing protein [Chloroflexota bacterium]